MDKHIAYQKLCEASEQAGCPVCRLALEAVSSYLDHLMYADVNAIRLREQLRLARGFCPLHARQVLGIGRALGVAIIYKDVLDNLARALEAGHYQAPAPWRKLQEARRDELATAATAETVSNLSSQRTCPACDERSMIEDVFLGTLDEHLDGDPPFVEILRRSDGLCLPHFRRALELVRSRRAYDVLADLQLGWWRALSAELAEFIRKNDYRFRHEGFAEEGDAWLRAVRRVIGEWDS